MATVSLPRATPESQGILSAALLGFVKAVEKKIDELHSFMLLRHGRVVAEGWWAPYAPNLTHMLFSLSKSFTSTAVGMAAAEGRLTVDDLVISFFSETLPEKVDPNLAKMRVRHLLSMATGHAEDATGRMIEGGGDNFVRGFLALPVENEPGSPFVYNSAATYMLSAIVQKVTGMKLIDYLQPRLFEPLGIEGAAWESCPRGINMGGWGLEVGTEDIARFGQLYLQKGMWQGKRLIPAAWVKEASSKQVSNGDPALPNEWSQGYGYQFWRCRYGAYRGDGAFGQYCIVMPEQDAVLAITSGVGDMQAVMNLAWEHILLPMGAKPLPEEAETHKRLTRKLAKLALRLPKGSLSSPAAAALSRKKIVFETNEIKTQSAVFDFTQNCVTVQNKSGSFMLSWGMGNLVKGTAPFDRHPAVPVAAAGVWTAEDTFTIVQYLYNTPFRNTITVKVDGQKVTLDQRINVSFGPTEGVTLVGKIE